MIAVGGGFDNLGVQCVSVQYQRRNLRWVIPLVLNGDYIQGGHVVSLGEGDVVELFGVVHSKGVHVVWFPASHLDREGAVQGAAGTQQHEGSQAALGDACLAGVDGDVTGVGRLGLGRGR